MNSENVMMFFMISVMIAFLACWALKIVVHLIDEKKELKILEEFLEKWDRASEEEREMLYRKEIAREIDMALRCKNSFLREAYHQKLMNNDITREIYLSVCKRRERQ